MSRLVPRIPKEISHKLPWQALLKLFNVETITGLEKTLRLRDGTLSKASRVSQTNNDPGRGLSANVHQALVEGMAQRFFNSEQMRTWMSRHWPIKLLDLCKDALEQLYEGIDLAHQIPQVGIFPTDYIERNEKTEIIDLLINSKQVQVLWITGPAGSGKSTLALSLVRRDWERLKQHYEKIFWVDVEQSDYADGLRQIGENLDLGGQSVGAIEQRLRNLTRKSKTLFILDALHDVSGLGQWRQLAGYLGKLVITSRTRLSENELRGDGLLQQIQLGGFSAEQARLFLADTDPGIASLVKQTEGLPLALRILNALMQELGLSVGEILARLNRYAFDVLEYPPGLDRRDASLRACFDITWQALQEQFPAATQYFLTTGIFKTRTIYKPILEQVAAISDSISGDRLAATLRRYNFLDLLSIHGERFIQLHPLLHAYAREKLASFDGSPQIQTEYLKAFTSQMKSAWESLLSGEYPFMVRWLAQDALAVLTELMARAEWQTVAKLLSNCFDLLLQEGYTEKLEEMLRTLEGQVRDDTFEARVLRMAIANHAGNLALSRLEVTTARARFELAYKMGEELAEQDRDNQDFLLEMCRAILGLGRSLMVTGQAQIGLNLVEYGSIRDTFERLDNDSLRADRDLLLGEMYAELGNPGKALEYHQAVFEACVAAGNNIQANAAQALLADSFRLAGQVEKATKIYRTLYEETHYPTGLKAELGLQLSGCLAETLNLSQAIVVLNEIDVLLADYEGWQGFSHHFARLWKYQAFIKQALGENTGALAAAQKSLEFWRKIPESGSEQGQMKTLIATLSKSA